MLRINDKFAKKYEEYRRKEELQKFKDKYGDVSLSEARKKSAETTNGNSGAANSDQGDSDSTSSESEDEDCEGWTPQTEAAFLRVYAALQTGDSRLYDPNVSWFREESGEGDQAEAENGGGDGRAHRPMFYNEYHRKFLLEGAYAQEDQTAMAETSEATQRDLREAEQIRKSLADSHTKQSESGDSASDSEDALLVKKKGHSRRLPNSAGDSDGGVAGRTQDPMARLHNFVSDQGDNGEDLAMEPELKEDLAKLKRRWTDERRLTDSERFLRDYITKEFWRPRPQATATEDEEPLSDDENFLARQSEFEAKWNSRSEEPDEDFEAQYRRTVASGEKMLADDDDDDNDDADLFVVKKRAPEDAENGGDGGDCPGDAVQVEVAADLRRLERQRQWRLESDAEDAAEEAAAEEAGESANGRAAEIRAYPRRITDSLRQATTDAARGQRRSERRERRQAEKLARKRELARLVALKEAEVEQRLERLRRNAGVAATADPARDRLADTLGGDFLDADFDPAEHDQRMARLFDEDFYGEDDAAKAKRPVFSDDEELVGREEAEAEAQRLRDEVDRMHAEDLIRAGPGQSDLRCRFNYRQVEPNDFGLSAVEILLADDRELNAWCSVRKASQYREREADRRDRRRFRSARSQARKARLMPGMLQQLEAAAAFPDPESWAAAAGETPAAAADTAAKRRRRKKKAKLSEKDPTTATNTTKTGAATDDDAEARPRCRKRLKLAVPAVAEEVTDHPPESKQRKKKNSSKQKLKQKPGLKISEQRLLELGIDPKKFRRMRRQLQGSTKPKACGSAEGLDAE